MSEQTNAEVLGKVSEVLAAIQKGDNVSSQIATIQSMLVSMASQQAQAQPTQPPVEPREPLVVRSHQEPQRPAQDTPVVVQRQESSPSRSTQEQPRPEQEQPRQYEGLNVLGSLLSEVLNRLDAIEAKIDSIQIPETKDGLA